MWDLIVSVRDHCLSFYFAGAYLFLYFFIFLSFQFQNLILRRLKLKLDIRTHGHWVDQMKQTELIARPAENRNRLLQSAL